MPAPKGNKYGKNGGRPTKYSPALAEKICNAIATSNMGLHRLCENTEEFPVATQIYRWIEKYEDFRTQYALAREKQADFLNDEITSIADEMSKDDAPFVGGNHVQRARLRIDARKWQASKLAPKKFGDKIDVTTGGEKITDKSEFDPTKLNDEELASYIALSKKGRTEG